MHYVIRKKIEFLGFKRIYTYRALGQRKYCLSIDSSFFPLAVKSVFELYEYMILFFYLEKEYMCAEVEIVWIKINASKTKNARGLSFTTLFIKRNLRKIKNSLER